MLGIFLALGASMAWGSGDFLGGLTTRRLPVVLVLLASQTAGLAVLGAVVAVRQVTVPAPGFVLPAMLAGVCVAVGLSALYRALAIGVMGVVAPIAAASAVIPVAVGIAVGERPGAFQMIGAIAAVLGVMMAVRQTDGDNAEGRRVAQGAGLAVLAAVAFGGFFVMIHASHGDLFWVLLVQRGATVALLLVVALAVAANPTPQSGDVIPLAAIGLLDAGATALFTASSRVGMLSVVSVVASLYPVVTLLLARVILRERLSPFQGTGVGLALVGIALIAV